MIDPLPAVSSSATSTVARYLLRVHEVIERWLQGDNWLWKVVLAGLLSPLFFFPTHSGLWNLPTEYWAAFQTKFYFWDTIEDQIIHPLRPIICYDENPGCHEDKMVFRLFLPALYALVRSREAVYAVQLLCWPVFLYLLARETYRLTNSKSVALYLALSIMGIYVGGAFPFDFVTCGDAFAYFLLLVAAVTRNRLVLIISLFLVYWVDERALINSVYVLVYRCLVVAHDQPLFGPKNVRTIATVVFTWVLYLGIRFWLKSLYNVTDATAGLGVSFLLTVPVWISVLKIGRSYEMLWVLVGVGLWGLWQQRQTLLLTGTLAALALSTVISIMVADTSRSLGYGLLLFLIVLPSALGTLRLPRLKDLMLVTALVCILFQTRFLLIYRPEIMYLFE
ncbi:hypothetical protein [Fibrella forsythiae]|uniref:Glycosyltransferase RgtA/B/C/D-like domain-containing protein n=1 Tax=Fibrella forsythiae TaxID=2817061 RepID=A0ABS3JK54_9BACT|nr:hypothetical protein [Fibrella forsythiae]MBO0950379.1 hypothetical protein [Fibrella forsythiae]